jgi:hypothetical protein
MLGSCANPDSDVIIDVGKVYNLLKGSGSKEGLLKGDGA